VVVLSSFLLIYVACSAAAAIHYCSSRHVHQKLGCPAAFSFCQQRTSAGSLGSLAPYTSHTHTHSIIPLSLICEGLSRGASYILHSSPRSDISSTPSSPINTVATSQHGWDWRDHRAACGYRIACWRHMD
jgi:hypothetical protein